MDVTRPPNIVLVVSDQQRADLVGSYGTIPVRTPTLDRLCREGTAFRRAYTATPVCTPTRATLLSGQYPSRHGAWNIGTDVPEDILSLPAMLAESAGYRTGIVGKSHFKSVLRPGSPEALPRSRDWEAYEHWTGPWYGFQHAKISNGHVDEPHAYSMHYGAWLREKGIPPAPPYFLPDPASTVTPNKDPSERTGRWELPEEFHSSRWVADEAISFLRGAADDRSRPFYLVVNFHDPHMPFRAPDPWHAMHDDVELPEPARREGEWQDKPSFYRATIDGCQDELGLQENPEVGIPCQQAQYVGHQGRTAEEEQMWRTYLGMQSLLDHHLGRICDTLDDLGFTDDTLLVYTSDHGDYMGDHWLWSKGPSHYDAAVRVPMIVRWPGHVPAGVHSDALQSLVDVPVTFASAAGVGPDPRMQGTDQLACWTEPARPARHGVLIEHRAEQGLYVNSWITDRHRLSVHSLLTEDRDEVELYDFADDPDEFVNLAADGGAADLVKTLSLQMIRYRLGRDRQWQSRKAFS